MWKFGVFALACALCSLGAIVSDDKKVEIPLPPNTAEPQVVAEKVVLTPTPTPAPGLRNPVRLIIPSIKLDDTVVDVGVNKKGEMDVPNGNTKNIGWYKDGTTPTDTGTAVFDAHVFAAFSKLRYVKVGGSIYVVTENGKKLHFVVTESMVYKLADLSSNTLFGSRGYAQLNLITCAGKLTPDHSTYDHRLVVFTKYVGEE